MEQNIRRLLYADLEMAPSMSNSTVTRVMEMTLVLRSGFIIFASHFVVYCTVFCPNGIRKCAKTLAKVGSMKFGVTVLAGTIFHL